MIEKFRSDILCWNQPHEVNNIMNGLLVGTVASLIVFLIVPLQWLMIGGIWGGALGNLMFVKDLAAAGLSCL